MFEIIQLEHALATRSCNDRTTLQTVYLRFKVLKFRDPRSLRYTTNLVWNIDKRQANGNFKNERNIPKYHDIKTNTISYVSGAARFGHQDALRARKLDA